MSVDAQATSLFTSAELSELTVTQPKAERPAPIFVRIWSAVWPKLLAVGIVVAFWQFAYIQEWKPHFLLPQPLDVVENLWDMIWTGRLWQQIGLTMRRGATGYAFALAIGTLLGIAVVQWRVLRLAIGSLIAGLQTMPSIAWFPLSILLFGLNESAITFVVVLGAAPSIAAGVINGVDEVPPPLLRAGKMLGATGISRYRHVVLPAAMPAYLSGLKQGWAFSWRSLLAGELLVSIGGAGSLGSGLNFARQTGNALNLYTFMIVILIVGIVVDAVFGVITRRVRHKRGLTGLSSV
jgi:sulfonate transport system permease protein